MRICSAAGRARRAAASARATLAGRAASAQHSASSARSGALSTAPRPRPCSACSERALGLPPRRGCSPKRRPKQGAPSRALPAPRACPPTMCRRRRGKQINWTSETFSRMGLSCCAPSSRPQRRMLPPALSMPPTRRRTRRNACQASRSHHRCPRSASRRPRSECPGRRPKPLTALPLAPGTALPLAAPLPPPSTLGTAASLSRMVLISAKSYLAPPSSASEGGHEVRKNPAVRVRHLRGRVVIWAPRPWTVPRTEQILR